MKEFLEFGLGILNGIQQAVRTDVDVFLMALAALCLSIRILRGLGFVLLFYVAVRRGDGLMKALLVVKRHEIEAIKNSKQLPSLGDYSNG